MTGEEFVKNCFVEKEAILGEYFAPDTRTEAGMRIRAMVRGGVSEDSLRELLDLILRENYYTFLMALEGEASMNGHQIPFKLYDEQNNLLNPCGEIEAAAWEYFMETSNSAVTETQKGRSV